MLNIRNAQSIGLAIMHQHDLFREGLGRSITGAKIDGVPLAIVAEEADSAQLIAQLRRLKALPDMCLLGMKVKDGNIYSLIQQLRSLHTEVKILLLCDQFNQFAIGTLYHSGAAGFLLQNNTAADLLQAITSVHTTGSYHPAGQAILLRKLSNPDSAKQFIITEKERWFLQLCCSNRTYDQIAKEMNKSPDTIKDIGNGIFKKVNINTRQELAMFAIEIGLH